MRLFCHNDLRISEKNDSWDENEGIQIEEETFAWKVLIYMITTRDQESLLSHLGPKKRYLSQHIGLIVTLPLFQSIFNK